MKSLIVFAAIGLLVVCTSATCAQQVMIGARGGVNFASEHYDSITDYQMISANVYFLAGAQFDYWFNKSLAMSIQPMYIQKGAHAEAYYGAFGPPGHSEHADWTITYFELPLLAKWSFGNGSTRPYLFVGPSIGFLHKNNEVVSPSSTHFFPGILVYDSTAIDSAADITDSTAKIELSLIAGGGITFNFDSGMQFFIEAGYAFGVTNINHYPSDEQNDAYIYSRDIRLAAGILFPIK